MISLNSFFSWIKARNSIYFFSVIIIALCYTALRFHLNIEYKGATWEQLFNLRAPIPFGYRVLVPVLSRPIVFSGFSVKEAYMFWEFISSVILIIGLYKVFSLHIGERWAKTFSLTFIYILPLLFLLQFKWLIYYPYDTLAMAFIVLGVFFMLEEKWFYLSCILLIATLNRESSILIAMIFSVVYIDRLSIKKFVTIMSTLFLIYFIIRWGIHLRTIDNPAPYKGAMAFIFENNWRVNNNIKWLFNAENILILLSTFGWLPLFYFKLKPYIPEHMKRFHITAYIYFAVLLFIGNLYEPRIFGEIIIVLYMPLALALYSYLQNTAIPAPGKILLHGKNSIPPSLISYGEKFIILVINLLIILVIFMLNNLGTQYFY